MTPSHTPGPSLDWSPSFSMTGADYCFLPDGGRAVVLPLDPTRNPEGYTYRWEVRREDGTLAAFGRAWSKREAKRSARAAAAKDPTVVAELAKVLKGVR